MALGRCLMRLDICTRARIRSDTAKPANAGLSGWHPGTDEPATTEGECVMDEREMHEAYDAMLDETVGDIVIGNLTYSASFSFARIDPIAYRVGLSEFADSLEA
jgi:hypothetical protein